VAERSRFVDRQPGKPGYRTGFAEEIEKAQKEQTTECLVKKWTDPCPGLIHCSSLCCTFNRAERTTQQTMSLILVTIDPHIVMGGGGDKWNMGLRGKTTKFWIREPQRISTPKTGPYIFGLLTIQPKLIDISSHALFTYFLDYSVFFEVELTSY